MKYAEKYIMNGNFVNFRLPSLSVFRIMDNGFLVKVKI